MLLLTSYRVTLTSVMSSVLVRVTAPRRCIGERQTVSTTAPICYRRGLAATQKRARIRSGIVVEQPAPIRRRGQME